MRCHSDKKCWRMASPSVLGALVVSTLLSASCRCGLADKQPSPAPQVCEKGSCFQDGRQQNAIRAFETWIAEQSLPVNKLALAGIPGYRMGTIATTSIPKGSLYISVPEHLLIGPEKIARGTALHQILSEIQQKSGMTNQEFSRLVDTKSQILMFLLREKHVIKDSLWKEYIDVLPQSVSVPTLFSEEELDALQDSEVKPAAQELKRGMRRKYDELRKHIFSKDRVAFPKHAFTLKEWIWAFILYDSRVIQLNRNTGRGNVPTFIPLIDMVNCRESHDQSFIMFNPKTRTADMLADDNFRKGEQVFETYGNKSNYEYLLFNGFVMKDNPNQCVHISLPAPSMDPALGRPLTLKFCLDPKEKDTPIHLKRWGQAMQRQGSSDSGLERVIDWLDTKLARYATAVKADKKLLKDLEKRNQDDEENLRWAVMLRMHEKKVLLKARQKLVQGEWKCCSVKGGH